MVHHACNNQNPPTLSSGPRDGLGTVGDEGPDKGVDVEGELV